MAALQEKIDGFFNRSTSASIFVGADPFGIYDPLPQFAMEFVTDNDYNRFREFIRKSVESVKSCAFIPDAHILFYNFKQIRDVPKPGKSVWNEYVNKVLIPYCEKNGIEPAHDISLRDAAFVSVKNMDVEDLLKDRSNFKNDHDYAEFIKTQNERERFYHSNPYFQSPLQVLQTNKGSLIFSSSAVGEYARKKYLQEIADNYFKPNTEINRLKTFKLYDCSPEIAHLVDRCYKLSPNGLSTYLDFGSEIYAPKEKVRAELSDSISEISMWPSAEHFQKFIAKTGTTCSHENDSIYRLLIIKETGYHNINSNPFAYSERFKELGMEFEKLSSVRSAEEFDTFKFAEIGKRTSDLADEILKTDFDVSGHRSIENILADKKSEIQLHDVVLGNIHKEILVNGDTLYLGNQSNTNSDLKYAWVDFLQHKIMLSPIHKGKVFQVINNEAVPYKMQEAKISMSKPKKIITHKR